jgi:flagellar hook protein FlgE
MSLALNSGISGLQGFQTAMSVVGNNIANISTTGYKSQSASFENSLLQNLGGATAPTQTGLGGTNPLQMGGGVKMGSVDAFFGQGSLQTTGNTTDMAIQGPAFFAVSDGSQQFYTRDGAFSLDANGNLVMPANGLVLQGLNADSNGDIPSSATVGNVTIPYDTASPAQATTQIQFARNLDANSQAQGTVTVSQPFLEYAAPGNRAFSTYISGPEPLDGLMNSQGQNLYMDPGSTLTFSASSVGVPYTSSYTIQSGDTFATLSNKFQSFLQTVDPSASVQPQYYPNTASMGALTIVMGNKEIDNLQVTSSNPSGASQVAEAFSFPSVLTKTINPYPRTDTFRQGAVAGQILRDSYTSNGTALSGLLSAGDTISVHATVGGQAVGGTSTLTYNPATTTWQQLLTLIQNNLALPGTDGTSANNPTVSMDPQGSNDNIADGSIIVRGSPGAAFAVSDIQVTATDSAGAAKNIPLFTSNLAFTQTQAASDAVPATTSITTYDALGAPHNLSVTFTQSQIPNTWAWQAAATGSDKIAGGGSGTLTFGPDGTVSSFTYADGSGHLVVDPGDQAPPMTIQLDAGGQGQFTGLTQFNAATTAAAISQDGHAMGSLQSISLGKDGIVTGQFSNGTTRSLAQVMLADFTNPGGLTLHGGSVYAQSANSGEPVLGKPGSGSASTVDSGSLELSNVDLSRELTNMITDQQGFSANSKVITTSSKLLQDVLNMR